MNAWRRSWRIACCGLALGLLAASAAGQWLPTSGERGEDRGPGAKSGDRAAPQAMPLHERQIRLPSGQTLGLSAEGDAVFLHSDAPAKVLRTWPIPQERRQASLTLLPSGRVLVWGGEDRQGNLLPGGLLFDPDLKTLEPALELPLAARVGHTATVLTDGRVLFAGGRSQGALYQLWDERTNSVTEPEAGGFVARRGHIAMLQADGRVRLSGGMASQARTGALLFDPATASFSQRIGRAPADRAPGLAASFPEQAAQSVPTTPRLSLRFSQRIRTGDLDTSKVTLVGPGGATPVRVVTVEQGRLAFVTPQQELFPDTAYTLLVNGVHTIHDEPVPLIAVDFRTAAQEATSVAPERVAATPAPGRTYCSGATTVAAPCRERAKLEDGIWTPGKDSTGGRWRVAGRKPKLVTTESIAPATKATGFATLIGEIRRVDGLPVANVEVSVGEVTGMTDADGQFALYRIPSGRQELYVDGTTANKLGAEYGQFVVGVDVQAGKLTQLPYTMYLPRIAQRDKIRVASPTKRDVVLTHPDMPGLMVHVPAGTVFRDRKGRIVRELAIVPTPVNRAPFPVAENYPMYFTLEPGGAVIQGLTPEAAKGVKIFYPNYDKHPAGSQANFWIYDPAEGWRVYGKGRVTSNGRVFAPEAGVALHQTMGGSYSIDSSEDASEEDVPPDCQQCGEGNAGTGGNATAGDPIDLRTGRFSYAETDITISDVMPIVLGRNYRPYDRVKQDFGIGTASSYHYRLHNVPGTNSGTIKLILPNGVPLYFQRFSGDGYSSVWRHYGTTSMSGARMELISGEAFRVTMPDGSAMQFGKLSPNALQWIQDRYGNRTEFLRDAGLVTKIVSPSGRWIELDRDSQNRIVEAWDSLGNTWRYEYNAEGLLKTVVYPDETTKTYKYDATGQFGTYTIHWLTEIIDRRGNRLIENEWALGINDGPSFGKVVKQTLADGSVYEMDYFHDDGTDTGVLVTHPDGSQRRVVFDPNSKYPLSDTLAYGTPLAQTFTFERDSFGRMTARTDPLGRRTEYGYNAIGQVSSVTSLAGTSEAISAAIAYNSDNQPASVTDALDRTTTLHYDNGCLVRITNPLNKHTDLTCNGAGQPDSVTDALGNTITLDYYGYDLAAVTDPLGRSLQFRHDALGRVVVTEDAQGNITRREYDAEGRAIKAFDALDRVTEIAYDPNGNVTAVLMPHGNGITYEYDSRDRLVERTDSLGQTELWTYDTMSRVTGYTDRKEQITEFIYDALGRLTTTTYHDGSVVTATYDAGNRRLSLADTATGTLGWLYDDLDRVIEAITPQGNIAYEYDVAGRRTAMTAASQARVEYQYDAGDRLRRLLQGSEVYDFEYDDLGRLIGHTLPNGIEAGYAYNAASQLTGMAWLKPDNSPLHDLGYGYNSVGQRVAQTGSLAPQALPPVSADNAFDDNNRQTAFNGATLTYDANGNLTGDGSRTYVWNARNQLAEIKQGTITVASFGYDVLGRRYTKTEGGSTVEYLHDGLDPVQETRGAAVEPILAGLGIDERYARGSGTGRRYFIADGLGSTRLLTDTSGGIVNRYDYDPYGGTTQTNPTIPNGYRYTGREQDASGLYYYRARYYHPGMGRFVSEDSYGLASGDQNFYAYALGNPVINNDPTGNIVPVILGVWAAIEIGLTIYDIYNTGRTFLDPCASGGQKAASAGLLLLGFALPGGGYTHAGNTIYRSMRADGTWEYVGITNDFARRAREHAGERSIQKIPGLSDLSRADARAVEQALINRHGLGSRGGTLSNQRNSISPSNPSYASQVARGEQILGGLGI